MVGVSTDDSGSDRNDNKRKYQTQSNHLRHKPKKKKRRKNKHPSLEVNSSLYGSRFQERYSQLEITDQIMAQEEVVEFVNKTIYLRKPCSDLQWELPPTELLFSMPTWKDEVLQNMKTKLNTVKMKLEIYDMEIWRKHTHYVNPASRVPTLIKTTAKPELVTQAFSKFYEILHKFPLIPRYGQHPRLMNSKLNTLHLCEAPGAFVIALNHYLTLKMAYLRKTWIWVANSLNPYFEGCPSSQCVSDDRFILNTLPNWFFGKDQTGDVTSPACMEELIDFYKKINERIHIVTADGSVDCQENPGEQEGTTHILHLSQVYVALSLLEETGCLVLKIFTIFECETVNLLYLLCCIFDRVAFHKPICSKMGNSEVYVIASGFRRTELLELYLAILRNYLVAPRSQTTMFPKDQLPESFLRRIRECCKFFNEKQMKGIETNIKLFESPSQKEKQFSDCIKHLVMTHFRDQFECRPIDRECRLVSKAMECDTSVFSNSTFRWGEQINKKSKTFRISYLNERLSILTEEYTEMLNKMIDRGNVKSELYVFYEMSRFENETIQWDVQVGKQFHDIWISRLCNSVAMQAYVQYFKESLIHDTTNSEVDNSAMYNSESLTLIKRIANDQVLDLMKQDELTRDALIIDGGAFVGPHNGCNALKRLISLITEKKLKEAERVVIINAPLFTRLQAGVVFVLRKFFEKTIFHIYLPQGKLLDFFPVIIFSKYSPREDLVPIASKLAVSCEWHNKSSGESVHQLINIKSLVTGRFHAPLCMYNYAYALWNTSVLKIVHSNQSVEQESVTI